MSAKKFEKLIHLIVNEDNERANQLFHDIVVEKSREIYESIMAEDQSMGFLDEIGDEEVGMGGMMEDDEEEFGADEELDGDFDSGEGDSEFGDEDMGDEMGDEEFGDEMGDEELEDRVIDLEDKLDQLMADFEAQMGGDDEIDMGDEGMDDAEGSMDDMDDEGMDDEDEEVMESVELKKVSVTHGDNGAQTKSPGLANPKRIETGATPVKFAGDSETVPTSAKKPSNAYSKGEREEDFGNINKVGGNAGKTAFATRAPAPKVENIKARSPVAETKRTTKRRI